MLRTITIDIITAFIQYVPYAIIIALVIVAELCFFMQPKTKHSLWDYMMVNRRELLLTFVFYVYVFTVIGITYFSREPGSRDGLDLMPFSTMSWHLEGNIYPIENVLLFIPFGFLLPLRWKWFRYVDQCITTGFWFSFAIELSQLITKRGFCQTDDILTNVLGTFMGFLLYRFLRFLVKKS